MRLTFTLHISLLFVTTALAQSATSNIANAQPSINPNHYNYENKRDRSVPNRSQHRDEEMEMVIGIYSASAVLLGTLALAASCVLAYKCMERRSQINQLKNQMQLRKHQFATQLGLSVFELDNSIGHTTHL